MGAGEFLLMINTRRRTKTSCQALAFGQPAKPHQMDAVAASRVPDDVVARAC